MQVPSILYKGPVGLASEMPDRHREGTGFHNVVLVDGKEQYQAVNHAAIAEDTDGKLEGVYTTPDFNYLIADATDRYRDKLSDNAPGEWMIDEWRRHVLFVKPSYLIMVDNLRSDQAHRYDWICHFSDDTTGSVTVEDAWIKGAANATDILGVKVLAPDTVIDTMGFSVPQNYTKNKPYIRIRPQQNIDNTQFITVLYPTTASSWSSKPDFMLFGHTEKAAGIRMVIVGGIVKHFINYSSDKRVAIGDYILSGKAASVEKGFPDNMNKLFLCNGDTLSDSSGARILLQSPRLVTVEAVYADPKLSLYGDSLQGVKIYGPGIDADQVTVNSIAVPATKEGNYIVVGDYVGIKDQLSAGQKTVVFRYLNNSTHPRIAVSFMPALPGEITCMVYAVNGKMIYKATQPSNTGRINTIVWNGGNQSGQRIGSGVYLFCITSRELNFKRMITITR